MTQRRWDFKHGSNADASERARTTDDARYGHHSPEARRARRWMGQKKPRRMSRMCSRRKYIWLPGICFTERPCKAMTRVHDGRWWLCEREVA